MTARRGAGEGAVFQRADGYWVGRGHATLAVTSDIYAKVTDDAKRRALVNLDRALGSD